MTAVLDLVRERIDAQLDEAHRSITLAHLGLWIGVFDEATTWVPPSGLRQYGGVADAAIVFAATGDDGARQYFTDGLEWLRRRRFFVPGQPKSLEADPVACLALAVGIESLGDTVAGQWLVDIAGKALGEENCEHRIELFKLTRAVAAGDALWAETTPLMRVACARRLRTEPTADDHRLALKSVLATVSVAPEMAIFHQAALTTIFALEASVDLAKPTIGQVAQLLRGISPALKRWPWEDKAKTQHKDVTAQRWDIQHEYHVQSLAWAVLRPVFAGLEDEENLPSLGHKHPRADLLVPSLRLVIEVKYVREATQSARAKVIEEIAADTAIYRTKDSGYDTIIAFIWDATGSTHHHAEIEAGIRKLDGIADVVIVSRPGEWQ